MNNYKKTYGVLNEQINTRKNNVNILKNEMDIERRNLWKKTNEIKEKKNEIRILNYQANKVVSSNDLLVRIPMTLLTAIIIVAVLYLCYNIVLLPKQLLTRIIVPIITFFVGIPSCAVIIGIANAVIDKIEKKLHKKNAKSNPKFKELLNKINEEKQNLEALKQEEKDIIDKINILASNLAQEKELIASAAQELATLKKEMLDIVLDEEQETLETLKAYTRVKKQKK